jgi:ATP-binding cassette subfamily F protein 3
MQIGYFEQTHVNHLIDTRTVEEEILYSHPEVDRQQARNICGAMLFQGDHALKKIQVLSGGEKSRVMLGKLLVTPLNLLVLDEPTNHLDLDSSDALLAAIDSFNGTVLMVTHNEMYLHALANRLIIFQNGGVEVFEGSYQRFLEEVGWKEENRKSKHHRDGLVNKKPALKKTKKELRRHRSEIIATRSNKLKTIRQQISRIENEIDTQEKKLIELDEAMITATQDRLGTTIEDISKSMHTCRSSIEKLFNELETLTNNLEAQRSAFDQKLKQLGSKKNKKPPDTGSKQ